MLEIGRFQCGYFPNPNVNVYRHIPRVMAIMGQLKATPTTNMRAGVV